MKQILHRIFGFGKMPRRPLLPVMDEKVDAIFENDYLIRVLEEEGRIV